MPLPLPSPMVRAGWLACVRVRPFAALSTLTMCHLQDRIFSQSPMVRLAAAGWRWAPARCKRREQHLTRAARARAVAAGGPWRRHGAAAAVANGARPRTRARCVQFTSVQERGLPFTLPSPLVRCC